MSRGFGGTSSFTTNATPPIWERRRSRGGAPYQFARVDRNAEGADHLDGVLLVFMAARPREFGGGQVVVGWYRDATLYPTWREPNRSDDRFRSRKDWGYCCECAKRNAVLLPRRLRNWEIPHGPGGMGQAKIRCFQTGPQWMLRVLDQIEEYDGPSLLEEPGVEAEAVAATSGERAHAGSQGFMVDPRLRAVIEERAIALAKKVYCAGGYEVRVVGQPFDLHCHKSSRKREDLWVEVKGTQGQAGEIILTRGEVDFYSQHYPRTELFVVQSIRVEKGVARGGRPLRYRRWRARADALRPITYWYRLPARTS